MIMLYFISFHHDPKTSGHSLTTLAIVFSSSPGEEVVEPSLLCKDELHCVCQASSKVNRLAARLGFAPLELVVLLSVYSKNIRHLGI